ncbi:MAG: sigma-70 family RNA polymerase sigma factor, partial [Anaerolineae bacterium]|nr:sigma-70 family RNA polymerase sigma factor [Anaerolineae bacterium]
TMFAPRANKLDALYRRYVTRVYRYCLLRVGSAQDAEDLTAQTFLAALESLGRYRERGSFAAWLFTIARRQCHSYHRRRYRHPEQPLEAAQGRANPGAPDPERHVFRTLVMECVQRVLPQLTDERQEVVRLRYGAGLSTAETAAVMGKGQSAVKMLLLRALNDLQERCLDGDE